MFPFYVSTLFQAVIHSPTDDRGDLSKEAVRLELYPIACSVQSLYLGWMYIESDQIPTLGILSKLYRMWSRKTQLCANGPWPRLVRVSLTIC